MTAFLNVFIAGLINGGIYALIALGLSLQYGVAKVINVAHGQFIMIGALITFSMYTMFHINPLLSVVISGPIIFAIGFGLHRGLFRYLKIKSGSQAAFEGNSMLAAFGLLFILQNVALLIWGGNVHPSTYLNNGVSIAGAVFSANRLIMLGLSLIIGGGFFVFLARTRMGKAIRAASQDPDTARLMGVNIDFVLALCFGLGALMAGIAGLLASTYTPFDASVGLEYTVIALIVVVLGGLGSIPGSFIGGFILGIVGAVVTYFQPSLYLVAYYVLFMALLIARPTGLLGK